MDHKNRPVTDIGLSCFPTSCYPPLYKLLTLLKFRGQKVNNSLQPAVSSQKYYWVLTRLHAMCCPQLHEELPPAFWALFGISHQSGTSSFISPVVWMEEKQGLATLTQLWWHPPFTPMPVHLPTSLAHAPAIPLSCLKAKVQSLQAEVVPISSDGSISIMGITKSHFAAH